MHKDIKRAALASRPVPILLHVHLNEPTQGAAGKPATQTLRRHGQEWPRMLLADRGVLGIGDAWVIRGVIRCSAVLRIARVCLRRSA